MPLSAFDAPEEGSRRTTIGQEAWDEANAPDEPEFMSNALFSTDQFTGRDKLAEAGSVRRTGSSKRSRKGGSGERPAEEPHRARRRRSTKVSAESDHASKQDSQEKKQDKQSSRSSSSKRKPRRRSDQKTGEAKQSKQSAERSAKHQKPQRTKEEGRGQLKSGPRPGQRSSVFARSLKSRRRLRGRVNRERAVSVLRRAALPRKTSIVARAGARTRPAAARKTKAKESKCPSTTRF